MKKLNQENFLPHLFFGKLNYISPIIGNVSTIPVNKSGLSLQNLVTPANEKFLGSQLASTELTSSVAEKTNFKKKSPDDVNNSKIEGIFEDFHTLDHNLLLRAK